MRNSGRSPGRGAAGQLKWSVDTGSESAGFQVILGPDGTIYHTTYGTQTTPGKLVARNPSDGSVRWTFTAFSQTISTIPAVGQNGLIYFADSLRLYAVDLQTGVQRWVTIATTGSPDWRSPTIGTDGTDGTVYFPGAGGTQAFDGATGAQRTNFAPATNGVTGMPQTTPAMGPDGELYVGGGQGGLYSIDRSGCTRWSKAVGHVGGTAMGDDLALYATVHPVVNTNIPPTQVIAFDRLNGNIKWTTNDVPGHDTPPAIGPDGTVYVLGALGELTALDPATGAVKWSFDGPGANRASPAIGADGTIYILSGSILGSDLLAIDPATGVQKWAYRLPSSPESIPTNATPTIATDGTIYVATFGFQAGKVFAIKATAPACFACSPASLRKPRRRIQPLRKPWIF